MSRATNNVASHRRHKKYLKAAKGNYGARSRLYRTARETVEKGWRYAYRDRRVRRRVMRRLWIIRINAAARELGRSYSNLMNNLDKAGVQLDRKMLAHLAATDPEGFAAVARSAADAG